MICRKVSLRVFMLLARDNKKYYTYCMKVFLPILKVKEKSGHFPLSTHLYYIADIIVLLLLFFTPKCVILVKPI